MAIIKHIFGPITCVSRIQFFHARPVCCCSSGAHTVWRSGSALVAALATREKGGWRSKQRAWKAGQDMHGVERAQSTVHRSFQKACAHPNVQRLGDLGQPALFVLGNLDAASRPVWLG